MEDGWVHAPRKAVDAALATERRATVERIEKEAGGHWRREIRGHNATRYGDCLICGQSAAILDAEAQSDGRTDSALRPQPKPKRGRTPGQVSAHAERDAIIVDRIRKGETLQAVATDYGISRQRIEQIIKREGIKLGMRRSPAVDAMVAAYQAGESLDAIAARLGYSYSAARAALQNRGIVVPRKPPYRKYLTTPHGTYYGYAGYGCKCDLCMDAARAQYKKGSQDRKTRVDTLPPEKHGLMSTYLNWGCRCQPCTTANTIYNKPYSKAWNTRNRDKINAHSRAKRAAKRTVDNAGNPRVESFGVREKTQ
jgi:uncharacterized protein (DUF433 family)